MYVSSQKFSREWVSLFISEVVVFIFIVSDDDLSSHDSDEASHDLSLSSDES